MLKERRGPGPGPGPGLTLLLSIHMQREKNQSKKCQHQSRHRLISLHHQLHPLHLPHLPPTPAHILTYHHPVTFTQTTPNTIMHANTRFNYIHLNYFTTLTHIYVSVSHLSHIIPRCTLLTCVVLGSNVHDVIYPYNQIQNS